MPMAEEYRSQAAKCARLARGLSDDLARKQLLELEREFRDAADQFEVWPNRDKGGIATLVSPADDRVYADDQPPPWPTREDEVELRIEAANYIRRLGEEAIPFLREFAEMAALNGDALAAEAWSDIAETATQLLAV